MRAVVRPSHWLFLLTLSIVSIMSSVATPASTAETSVPSPGACADVWTQVNEGAFALSGIPSMPIAQAEQAALPNKETFFSTADYNGEEGYEVLVFDNQLYLGMEADNTLGARLWRTRAGVAVAQSQADWEEVAADEEGRPFGSDVLAQHDHIDSLAAFQNMLYVSTASRSGTTSGTLVYRSPTGDPASWTPVNSPGFGDEYNTNFKDMRVFDGRLCGGTVNAQTGAEVWCTTDGTSWTQHNRDGFGSASIQGIWSSGLFRGALYVGVNDRSFSTGRLFRTSNLDDPESWEQVLVTPAGSLLVDILGVLDGYLYVSARSSEGVVIFRSASGDVDSWEPVNQAGMDGSPSNIASFADGAAVYADALFVSLYNDESGVEVWRTRGTMAQDELVVDWAQVGGDGLGDPDNKLARLIVFNDYLYAWTSNYASGQQVRRIGCSPFERLFLPAVLR